MSEGGLLAWKRQTIDTHRGPSVVYDDLHRPLGPPPKNMYWVQDGRDWRLEPKAEIIPEAYATTLDNDNESSRIHHHTITPTDTFQGICLKYKITPTELRQANCFSGSNLVLAPNPLKIPGIYGAATSATIVAEEGPSNDDLILSVQNACPGLARSEAKCFLELNDWNLDAAILDAKEEEH